jgi:putative two-component system response regulator
MAGKPLDRVPLPPEEFGELEELEELEPEASVKTATARTAARLPGPISSRLLSLPGLAQVANSRKLSPEPFAILDAQLNFALRNAAFIRIITSFGYPPLPGFLECFSRSLSPEARREIRAATADPGRSYTWKGVLEHRFRDRAPILTRLVFLPLWSSSTENSPPVAYEVHLDDVTESVKGAVRNSMDSLLKASLIKDNDTGQHVYRLNRYAACLARSLLGDPRWPEVDGWFVDEIGFLAAFHDVGKLATPETILQKRGPLTEAEWKVMKNHTVDGGFIMSAYENPMGRHIARWHHVKWNGSGYPEEDGLTGGLIPLPPRIVSLCDVYDALRMKRSYKLPFDHETTAQKIVADAGTHFDPELVEKFVEVQAEFAAIYDEHRDADE